MKRRKWYLQVFISLAVMIVLILDPSTARQGVSEGLEVCIRTIIPALFPFFITTTYLNASLLGHSVPMLHLLVKTLHIPKGGDSLLLLGLIGGYPVGAQFIAQAYHNQQISKRTSNILLGYCSNAGPAFIFGITASIFSSVYFSILLWVLHIVSALITGYFLPRPNIEQISWNHIEKNTISSALKKSLNICAFVCGWVITFKVILSYLVIMLASCNDDTLKVLLVGFIELSNGCLQLAEIPSVSLRFVLCSVFLSFGGLCVLLQTVSATEALGLGLYIHGKIIQTTISAIMSILLSYILFPNDTIALSCAEIIIILCIVILLIAKEATKRYSNSTENSV